MKTHRTQLTAPTEPQIPVQVKIAAAWTSFMFLYIYVDYLHLYKPGAIDEILGGVVYKFQIGPAFLTTALASIAVPTLMIVLSTALPPRANRTTNLVVATLLIPYSVFNAAGTSWEWASFYGLSIGLELLLLAYILRSAWTWPGPSPASMSAPAAPRSQIPMGL